MEIKIEHGSEMIIRFIGRLDTVSSMELNKKVQEEEIKEDLVIFDMEQTEYISSAGLRFIIALKKDLSEREKQFELHHVNRVCLEVFKATGFDKLIVMK